MLNFDTELDVAGTTRLVRREESVSSQTAMTSSVTISRQPSEAVGFLSRQEDQWDWRDLRDYVVKEIEARFGTWPRDQKKEYGIFSRFLSTWGEHAAPIARYAFEVADGRWMSAPISVNRFCRGSDPIFAAVIVERLGLQSIAS